MFEIYNTADLLEVLRVQQGIQPYWLGFFPRQINSTSEEIIFDQVTDGTKDLAPFVAPNVQGRVMRNRGYTTKTFKPAYVKPKHVVDPSQAIYRTAGESIGGSLTPQQRWDARVAENLRMERATIENRWEWMAARAVIDSAVTVVGEDYPEVTVEFGRDASLTGTLTGTARWGEVDANPLKDIEDYRRRVNLLASATIPRLTFGLDAWDAFTQDDRVLKLLDTRYRGSDSDFNRAVPQGLPYEYRGSIGGTGGVGKLELYTYCETYRDEAGNLQQFLDQNTVVGTSPAIAGARCFGAIKDKRAQLAAVSMFPKMWDEEDPSVSYTMTQSAPLMVPVEPNASFTLKVR
jgi:hypothetical protein